jgi:hypothetical protein
MPGLKGRNVVFFPGGVAVGLDLGARHAHGRIVGADFGFDCELYQHPKHVEQVARGPRRVGLGVDHGLHVIAS